MYIKATAEAIWTAITDPEWTNRYGYSGYSHYDLRPGGALTVVPERRVQGRRRGPRLPDAPTCIVDGEVIEADPPHKLVTTWRMLMDPTAAAEPYTTITYEIKQYDGFCSLTVVHDARPAHPPPRS